MQNVRELKEKLQQSGGKDISIRQKLLEKIKEENKIINKPYSTISSM